MNKVDLSHVCPRAIKKRIRVQARDVPEEGVTLQVWEVSRRVRLDGRPRGRIRLNYGERLEPSLFTAQVQPAGPTEQTDRAQGGLR